MADVRVLVRYMRKYKFDFTTVLLYIVLYNATSAMFLLFYCFIIHVSSINFYCICACSVH